MKKILLYGSFIVLILLISCSQGQFTGPNDDLSNQELEEGCWMEPDMACLTRITIKMQLMLAWPHALPSINTVTSAVVMERAILAKIKTVAQQIALLQQVMMA